MAGPEAKIERRVCDRALKELGIANFKWGVDGWPDRVFLIPGGRPLIIEFKAPGEEPEPRQEFRIECLRKWGYEVHVSDNVEHAFELIKNCVTSSGKTML